MRDDDIDIEPDEFFGVFLGAVAPPVGIAELDLDVLTFRVAKGVQTEPESINERMRGRSRHQHANEGQFSRLLCQRCKRPCHRCAAEERNELAPSHVCSPQVEDNTFRTVEKAVLCITAFSHTRLPQRVKSSQSRDVDLSLLCPRKRTS